MYFDELSALLDAGKRGIVALRQQYVARCPIVTPRRPHLAILASAVLLAGAALPGGWVHAQGSYLLAPLLEEGSVQRVRVAIEIQGELKTNPDGKKVIRLPMAVNATQSYEEKLLSASGEKRRAARHYDEARAELRIKDNTQSVSLSEDRRLLVVQANRDETRFLSPQGALTRDELDLIDVPGNSVVASSLLPAREMRIGQSWTPAEQVLGLLLGLEAVSKSDVSATLSKVEGDIAIIDMAGIVQGAVGGVATEIELKAKLNVTLANRQLTWLAMALKENRAVGHAEPGFETIARVRVSMQPATSATNLTEKQLADLPAENDTGAALLKFESAKAGFRILHDRRWRTMVDLPDVAILRLVDRGDLIAQCNISPLPDLTPGKHLALEEFKVEIQEALGKNFGQIVEATQTKSESGLRVLKITASGTSSELPIQWIYYHLSNEQGRRAAYVFTLEARLLERFGAADDLLTSTFEFTKRLGPTPAGPSINTTSSPSPRPATSPAPAASKPATTSAVRPSGNGPKAGSQVPVNPFRR